MIQSEFLSLMGIAVILVGIMILIISGSPVEKKREIYSNYPFNGSSERVKVKPFRLFHRGMLTCTFTNIWGASGFRIYLTDLFPSMEIEHTWGPRYFQITREDTQEENHELGSGEYALVIDKRNGNVSGKFSLVVKYREYPRERLANWGLAAIDVGAVFLAVGLSLIYQK
jgi:hypothetical protein